MDVVPIITLVVAFLSLMLGGGLLMQKRKEGEAWGRLVTTVEQSVANVDRVIGRVDRQQEIITEFRVALLGIDGTGRTSGALADISSLRTARHEHGDRLHGQYGKLELHDRQLDEHERRITTIEDHPS